MAKHISTGNSVAIKYHKHRETRDYSAGILRQLNRKFVAGLALIKDETVFDDPQRYPDSPYAMVRMPPPLMLHALVNLPQEHALGQPRLVRVRRAHAPLCACVNVCSAGV